MKLFVKITASDFHHASRDKKELSVVKELGYPILVVAKGNNNGIKTIDGWLVHTRTTRPLGINRHLIQFNRCITLLSWALYIRKLKANYLSCHDLIALTIGWISTIGISKNKKPLLIYDSHEFEIGRNTNGKRSKLIGWTIQKLEEFLIKKSALTIMVNESIASEVQQTYHLKNKPLIIRNIPPYWHIKKDVCIKRRKEFCEKLNIPMDYFIAMYHGSITSNRGIEQLIYAASKVEDCRVVILGFGECDYIQKLKTFIADHDMDEKVLFVGAVPYNILWEYIGASNIGVMLDQNTCKSYYYSLPNKLFENIQAEVPILSSNFPEYKNIIENFNVGICCNSHAPLDIIKCLTIVKENLDLRENFITNTKKAKQELNWENEKEILSEAYSILLK